MKWNRINEAPRGSYRPAQVLNTSDCYTVYHPDPNVATVLSYLTVSYKWTTSVRAQHSGDRVKESVRVSMAWKRRRWPPWIWRMLSRKVFYFTVSPAACAAMLTASSLGDVWPASPPGSLSNGCPPRHSLQPRCLSGTQDPREIDVLFFFYNCSLISCPHNGLTILTCSWSCCRNGKIKFCVLLRYPTSDFCCILPLKKKLILVLFSV